MRWRSSVPTIGRNRLGSYSLNRSRAAPVVAYRRGSIPEIIEDGKTGFVCEGLDEMAAAVQRIPEIDRRRCRWAFEQRFSVARMAQDYLRVYEQAIGNACERKEEAMSFVSTFSSST